MWYIWHESNLWHGLNGSYPLFWPCGGTHWTGAVLYSLLQSLALVAQSRLGSSGTTHAGLLPKRLASAREATLNVAMLGPYLAPHETRMCFCPDLNKIKDPFCDVFNKNSI